MITRIVKLTVKPEAIEAFTTHYSIFKDYVLSQEGCHSLHLSQTTDGPSNVYYTFSIWGSEAALDAYRHTEKFKTEIWPSLKACFQERAEAASFVKID